jgi:hypothetical protein
MKINITITYYFIFFQKVMKKKILLLLLLLLFLLSLLISLAPKIIGFPLSVTAIKHTDSKLIGFKVDKSETGNIIFQISWRQRNKDNIIYSYFIILLYYISYIILNILILN